MKKRDRLARNGSSRTHAHSSYAFCNARAAVEMLDFFELSIELQNRLFSIEPALIISSETSIEFKDHTGIGQLFFSDESFFFVRTSLEKLQAAYACRFVCSIAIAMCEQCHVHVHAHVT